MAKQVTVIPPTINLHTKQPSSNVTKRKVAAYARVSTDSDEQFTSYEAQIDYYTQYIKRNPKFITALSTLLSDREELLKDSRLILAELDDNAAIDTECDNLIEEMDMLSAHIQKCVAENAVQVADQDEYIRRYNSLVERYEKLQSRYDCLQKKKERRLIQADRLSGFMFAVKELDLLQIEFNDMLWQMTVQQVTVYRDGRMVWRFRNGAEV